MGRSTRLASVGMGALPPVLATSDLAFDIVFSVFVVASLVLAGFVIAWVIRRDRVGRAEWSARRQAAATPDAGELGSRRRNGAPPAAPGDPRRQPEPGR